MLCFILDEEFTTLIVLCLTTVFWLATPTSMLITVMMMMNSTMLTVMDNLVKIIRENENLCKYFKGEILLGKFRISTENFGCRSVTCNKYIFNLSFLHLVQVLDIF